jgi:hypothetical protein
MPSESPFLVESLDEFDADAIFTEGRDQVIVGARITPVFGQLDLRVVGTVLDEAADRGFALAREHPYRDEYLLMVFEAYEDDEA